MALLPRYTPTKDAPQLAHVFDAARRKHVSAYEVPWKGVMLGCSVDPRGNITVCKSDAPDRERMLRPFKLGALEQVADAMAKGD